MLEVKSDSELNTGAPHKGGVITGGVGRGEEGRGGGA